MASDDQGLGTNGGVTISVGRDILIEDDNGVDANVGVSAVASTGAVVLTTGVGGTLSLAANSSAAIQGRSGGVSVFADRILIENDSGINVSSGGSAKLTSATAGRGIDVGSATDGVVALELSDAELDRVVATKTIVGGALAGQVTVVGALTHANSHLTLQSGQDILVQADITTPSSLTFRAAGNVTQTAASFLTTGMLHVFADHPDNDAAGGMNSFLGALALSGATITGNSDADTLNGTGASDTVRGGAGADFIWAHQGGNDAVWGEDGDDTVYFGAIWTSADSMDGGAGIDTLILQGNYNLTGVDGVGNIAGLEFIRLLGGANVAFGDLAGNTYNYTITTSDDDVAAGQRLVIRANGAAAGGLSSSELLVFDGSAETDGNFQVTGGDADDSMIGGWSHDHFIGGGGDDFLVGGAGDDRFRGDAGADALQGDAGVDTFAYQNAGNSTSNVFDTIIGFNPNEDLLDLPSVVTGWTGNVSGFLSDPTFDANIAAAVNGALQANSAVLFTANAGTYAGRVFAVIDGDGDGNYTAGTDYVIEFVTPTAPVDSNNAIFI